MLLATVESPDDPLPQPTTEESPEVILRMPAELLRWASVAVREARRRALEEMLSDRG